ncbi:hypothetical protein B0H10DRAFT_1906984 [Mycena sp. CBHHK59/15]|nr:hypothetical protein B0H10DRAFT_1906984 [Mycena sp. CBHHK59/15]
MDSIALLREAIEVSPDDLLCVKTIDAVMKDVLAVVNADLQRDINWLVKTHMLRNQLEMGADKSLTTATRRLRHYLTMVVVPTHRKAMTGLLLRDHNLSVERLRYAARYREAVPRQFRLCRFRRGNVEGEVRAIFDCIAEGRLIQLRTEFLKELTICDLGIARLYGSMPNYDFMLKLVPSRKAVRIFAKFIYLVLCVFQDTPCYFPVVFRVPG